ncbi:MAG: hypothetical protein RSF01_04710 [Bacteroidales bacterium]
MKKFIFIFLCFLFSLPILVTAKNNKKHTAGYREDYSYIDYKKSEIYIQYGAPSILELTNDLDNNTFKDKNGVVHKFKEYGQKYTGVGAIGYNYYINPYLCLGAYFGISEADIKIKEEASNKDVYTNHTRSYTGMLEFRWIYFRQGIWEASCGCSLGVAGKDEEQTELDTKNNIIPAENDRVAFAYNLTATRVRIGGTVGGFIELGFGYKGLVNAGLSVKF